MPLTKDQAAHLSQRIQDFWAANRYSAPMLKPAKVIAAEKVIADFEAKCEAANKGRAAKLTAAVAAARQAVHFSEPAQGLGRDPETRSHKVLTPGR